MVSIEDKVIYQLRINETPKLAAFNNLLLNKPFLLNIPELNESEEIYFGIISAIQSKNKILFETHYNKKKKSNPSKESPSPFVNDDFLIFCLIVGIVKFNSNKSWINNIIAIRSRNNITITFENIINENYFSKNNLPEIVLMFFQLTNKELINSEFLTLTFKSISENMALFESKSDFHIICAKCAYDLCIVLKESPDGSEIKLLQLFNEKFLKRVKILSWLVQTVLMFLFLFLIIKVFSCFPTVKTFFDDYDPIFGVLGLSLLGNFIPAIKKNSYEMLLKAFGYSNELITLKNKKFN